MHKPGFKLQARILHHLFGLVSSEAIQAPLWDVQNVAGGMSAYPNNHAFVQTELAKLLQTSFPNLRPQQIQVGWHTALSKQSSKRGNPPQAAPALTTDRVRPWSFCRQHRFRHACACASSQQRPGKALQI